MVLPSVESQRALRPSQRRPLQLNGSGELGAGKRRTSQKRRERWARIRQEPLITGARVLLLRFITIGESSR